MASARGPGGRNGGFLPIGTAEDYDRTVDRLGRPAARHLLALTRENRRLVAQVLEEEGIACDYRSPGHLHLALDDDEQAINRRLARLLTEDGSPVDHLSRREAGDHVGTPLGDRIVGGLWFREIGLVHPARLLAGLAAAAVRRGTALVHAEVGRIETKGGRATITTHRGPIEGGRLIVATNAWLGELIPALRGVIRPVRGQVLAFAPIRRLFETGMTAQVTVTEEYWQQAADGSIILGGCRAARPDHDEGVLSDEPTADVQSALEAVLPTLFPEIGPLRVSHRWAGPMAFTPDRLPVLAPLPGEAGWAAGGFSGHGMSLTMALGHRLAALACGGAAAPELDRFSPTRFSGTPE